MLGWMGERLGGPQVVSLKAVLVGPFLLQRPQQHSLCLLSCDYAGAFCRVLGLHCNAVQPFDGVGLPSRPTRCV
jgi:hypothetical protein